MLERKETKPQQKKLMCVNYTTDESLHIHCKDLETHYSECYNAQCFSGKNT
jgi:hypothetical protein